jgi:low affinity Fe/Cu permease
MPQPRSLRRARRRSTRERVSATRSGLAHSLEHPADRGSEHRGGFEEFSQRVSFLASSPLFFVLCGVLVLIWAIGLATGASSRFEAAAAGAMSAVTLVLVAVLKNAELRAERALQTKLDAIAAALLEDRRGRRGDAEHELERSIGVHEQI